MQPEDLYDVSAYGIPFHRAHHGKRGKFSLARLLAIAYLGTVSIIEPVLMPVIAPEGAVVTYIALLKAAALDLPIISIYVYFLTICIRHLNRYRAEIAARIPETVHP